LFWCNPSGDIASKVLFWCNPQQGITPNDLFDVIINVTVAPFKIQKLGRGSLTLNITF
jgi:hypothetical protein